MPGQAARAGQGAETWGRGAGSGSGQVCVAVQVKRCFYCARVGETLDYIAQAREEGVCVY